MKPELRLRHRPRLRPLLRGVLRFLVHGALALLLTGILILVLLAERRADLEPWHLEHLDEEFSTASKLSSIEEYLALEDRLFAQLDEQVYGQTSPAGAQTLNRYQRGGLADPSRWPINWNRTFELAQENPPAVALLLHGLSDSPYSLRSPALTLHERGLHVLGLRIPGHGTAPSGLLETSWRDMAAAVDLAMVDLARRFPGTPIYVVGYSNGAALALEYTLSVIEAAEGRPLPSRLVLIAPEIGVSPLAALAAWQARLAYFLGLDKLAWNDLSLEYDPFKYGSFAVSAGDVSHRLTRRVQGKIRALADKGGMDSMPPILAFSSVIDATVRAPDLVSRLFNPLPPGGHELVLFDINRQAGVEAMMSWRPDTLIAALQASSDKEYALTVVTNQSEITRAVEARYFQGAEGALIRREPLEARWPRNVFSLSHVALAFRWDDPLYGAEPPDNAPGPPLGTLQLRGERGALGITEAAQLRQRWNPFYDYLESRMLGFLSLDD